MKHAEQQKVPYNEGKAWRENVSQKPMEGRSIWQNYNGIVVNLIRNEL
jgi:hypothetical protein